MKLSLKYGIFIICLVCTLNTNGQTRGFIFIPGSSVFDPNGDGYVSQLPSGFSNDGYYVDEFEISMFPLANLGQGEVDSDNRTGPSCGFTDMVPDTGGYTAYAALDASDNFIFRFRLANSSSSANSYSVLIDTDNLFGTADPNYNAENPGFEILISLEGNSAVNIYNIDGLENCSDLKRSYALNTNSQQAIAGTQNCAAADYFYDFYVPFSDLTSDFGITTSTPLFLASFTSNTQNCNFFQFLSDIGGVDDDEYGHCFNCMFEELYCNQTSTPTDSLCNTCSGINFNPTCPTDCPYFSPIPSKDDSTLAGFAIGNSLIYIEVHYISPPFVLYDTIMTNASGDWSINLDSTLSTGDSIIINAQVSGRSVSVGCGYRLVENLACEPILCSSPPYNINELNVPQNASGFTGNSNEPDGTVITVYYANSMAVYKTATVTAGNWQTTSCGSPNCIGSLSYVFSATAPGKCESGVEYYGPCPPGNTSATPVITTNPITTNDSVVSGTADAGGNVRIYMNGYLYDSTTAIGANWTFTGVTFIYGDTVTVYSLSTVHNCWSAVSNQVIVGGVFIPEVNPPLVNSPLHIGDTIVSGTAESPQGTEVYIYVNFILSDTAIVDAFNNWTVTMPTALLAGDTIYATTVELCTAESPASDSVIVKGQSDTPSIDCGALNLIEGDTIIYGTSTEAAGSIITIYIDGDSIGTAIIDGAGNWADTVANTELYIGGFVYATAINISANEIESVSSDSCIVQCILPFDTFSVSISGVLPCDTGAVTLHLSGSQIGIVYTPYDLINDTVIGYSVLGNGDSLLLNSFILDTGTYSVSIEVLKIATVACEAIIKDTLNFTIYMCNEICNDAIDNDGDGLVDCADTLECRPTKPGIITTSNDTICAGVTGESYTIAPVGGATSYDWTAPAGATITAGQGTTLISVDWGSTSGNICVRSYNGFCYSDFSCATIQVTNPPFNPAIIFH